MAQIEYYMVFRWMREELHLENTELDCYAIIYSLSKGDNWFNAGVKNIMDALGKSEPCVINALKSLTKKEMIVKVPVKVNNVTRHYYKATRTLDEATLNNLSNPTLNNLSNPTLNNLSHINKENNKEVNKKVSNETKKEETRFSKPSLGEIKAYIEEKKLLYVDAEEFFNYYELTGWKVGKSMKKMKDWKAACRYWEVKHKEKNKCYEPQPDDDEMVVRFKKWMREKHPEIEFTEVPLTFDGYMRLQREYGMDEVCNQLDYIDANIGKFRQCDIEKSIIQYFQKA